MTIVGQWSVAELKDLVADKDVEMAAIKNAATTDFQQAWQLKDRQAYEAWYADWQALRTRYLKARSDAGLAISKAKWTPVNDAMIPAQSEFEGILRAMQKVPGTRTPGDKLDVMIRMSDAGAALHYVAPQPVAKDWDLIASITGGKILEQVDPALVGKPGLSALEVGGIVAGIGALAYLAVKAAK